MTPTGRRLHQTQRICALLLAFSAWGCSATGMVQTAQTLGKGAWEASIEPGIIGAIQFPPPGPVLNAALRYGVSDRVDIGARLGTSRFEFQSKFLLTAPENPSLAVALAPSFGLALDFAGLGFIPMVQLPVPLLIGLKFGQNELTIGPRLVNTLFFGPEEPETGAVYVLSAATSLGFAAQVTDTFRILPEFSLSLPAAIAKLENNSSTKYLPFEKGVLLYAFTLGFQFGSKRKKFTGEVMTQP